jgi:hypothetical protein
MLTKIQIAVLSYGWMPWPSSVSSWRPRRSRFFPRRNWRPIWSAALAVTKIIGISLGAILMISLVIARRRRNKRFLFELIAVTLMTLAMVISHFIISHLRICLPSLT